MQERSKLVILFYILTITNCSSHIAVYLDLDIETESQSPYIYDDSEDVFGYFEFIGSCSFLALGWLVTAIMY